VLVYVVCYTTNCFVLDASCQLRFHHEWCKSIVLVKKSDQSSGQSREHQKSPIYDNGPESPFSYGDRPIQYRGQHNTASDEDRQDCPEVRIAVVVCIAQILVGFAVVEEVILVPPRRKWLYRLD